MMNDAISFFSAKFNEQPNSDSPLKGFRRQAFADFSRYGLPPVKHEEWKYTRVSSLFKNDFTYDLSGPELTGSLIDTYRLPSNGQATELVFVNGMYNPALSVVRHGEDELVVMPLDEAAGGPYAGLVNAHLGHSADYHKDGIHALNTAFASGGAFILVKKGKQLSGPVYLYHFADSRNGYVFAQPRILVYVEKAASVKFAENYVNLGSNESLTNEVIELVAEEDSVVDYCKIQHEGPLANHVGTTHFRQIGKCLTNAVTITISGGMIRNNLNMIMESEHGESHMYGLYLLNGKTHADNHTIVDNVKPHCFSNELYKGIMDDKSTGVFNGKIFVRQDAQKTNAYQSNKNILLSDTATANTKPQLEIFADDVKCSHGCTIGRLDEEALFYLRARGIGEKDAKSLLLHAFAIDILENIKPAVLRDYVDKLISERLDFKF